MTDFGLRDHYVGAMKGVILGICPSATLVDISHDVPPQDVVAASLELAAAYRYFPAGTIFLVVVDPGVGSSRPAIAAAAGGYVFVAPDNGVLNGALADLPAPEVVELTEPRYQRPTVSRTFEGRDRFAPAAAWLATGVPLASLGPPAAPLSRLVLPTPVLDATGAVGQVVRVDRFGNLISNIHRDTLAQVGASALDVHIGTCAPALVATYADVAAGELCALVGSTGHLEVAVNGASAALRLGLGRGAAVHVVRRA
ncbi:MAG: SAM-dependent chlorinase/fluorinase [Acidobacteriota bacterium]